MKNEAKFKEKKPIIGITMGDPFGNGPEITVKALADPSLYKRCRPVVVGDRSCMEYAAAAAEAVSGIKVEIHPVSEIKEAEFRPGIIDVYDMGLIRRSDIPGDPACPQPFKLGATRLGGEASFRYVEKVIELAMDHRIDATVTNAFSKGVRGLYTYQELLYDAGS